MKPNVKLAETTTPDGARLVLSEHDGSYCIRLNGQQLMHSSVAESELLLGELAVRRLTGKNAPCILIGGLGLGFTLKSVLAHVRPSATVEVVELSPAIVEWNRQFLGSLNGALLNDPRVKVTVEDLWDVISRTDELRYDAVIIDIDNGPTALVQQQNARVYTRRGLQQMAGTLNAGGRAVFWSARPDPAFAHRLTKTGFKVEPVPAKLYPGAKRCACTLYVADV
jgi:spermidine synthase